MLDMVFVATIVGLLVALWGNMFLGGLNPLIQRVLGVLGVLLLVGLLLTNLGVPGVAALLSWSPALTGLGVGFLGGLALGGLFGL